MAIRGAKLIVGGGKNLLGVQKLRGRNKPIRKTKKKWRPFFCFLETENFLYFVGTPFESSGRAPFKLVTPLVIGKSGRSFKPSWPQITRFRGNKFVKPIIGTKNYEQPILDFKCPMSMMS